MSSIRNLPIICSRTDEQKKIMIASDINYSIILDILANIILILIQLGQTKAGGKLQIQIMSITKLSNDGVLRLFQDPSSSILVFQVISMTHTHDDFMMAISDGFVKVQVRLSAHAKQIASEGKLAPMNVVSIRKGDVNKLAADQNATHNFMLEVCNLNMVYDNIVQVIGCPMELEEFKKAGGNPNGSSNIILLESDRQARPESAVLTKKGDLLKFVGSNELWIFRGRITERTALTSKTEGNKFFFITIEDEDGHKLEGVFFREAAMKFNEHVQKMRTYIFSGAQIKQNRKNTDIEMVFYRDSAIEQAGSFSRPISPSFEITPLSALKQQPQNTMVNIIAMVCFCDIHPKYRKLKLTDESGCWIRAQLWPEINCQEVRQQTWYLFTDMRINVYNDDKNLTSSRSTRILDKNQAKQYPVAFPGGGLRLTLKPAGTMATLTIQEFQQQYLTRSQRYYYIVGLLRFAKLYSFEPRSLFYLCCHRCSSPVSAYDRPLCATCGESLICRYNLRCYLTDTTGEISAAINDEAAQSLLGVKAEEAFRMFREEKEAFRDRVAAADATQYLLKIIVKWKGDKAYFNLLGLHVRNKTLELAKGIKAIHAKLEMLKLSEKKRDDNKEDASNLANVGYLLPEATIEQFKIISTTDSVPQLHNHDL